MFIIGVSNHIQPRQSSENRPSGIHMHVKAGTSRPKVASRLIAGLVSCVLLNACSSLVHHGATESIPNMQSIPSNGSSDALAVGSSIALEPPAWPAFAEAPVLQSLLQELQRNNLDLNATAARLRGAQAAAEVASGRRWPGLQLSLDGNRQQRAGTSFSTAGSAITESVTGLFTVTWELDVWGGVALGAKAGVYSALQQAQLLEWSNYSLQAQFTKLWLDAVEAKQQLLLAEKRQHNLGINLDIIEGGFRSGIRDALDVYSAQAEYASAESNTRQREQALAALVRNLESLLGRYPAASLSIPAQAPEFPPLPADIPLAVLERRPDVSAAAHAIIAQHANLGVARINRLPGLNLRAGWGASNDSLHDVLSGDDVLWNVTGSLVAPLFQGGQLAAEQRRQQALLEASISEYKSTVLTALQEAEQSLANETSLSAQLEAANRASRISELAEQQAFESYVTGISNLSTWLQAQRTAFDRNSQRVRLRSDVLKNRVDLYLALGGVFTHADPDQ